MELMVQGHNLMDILAKDPSFFLIASNSNPGWTLHCWVLDKDTASNCPSKSRHGSSLSELEKDTTEEDREDWRRRVLSVGVPTRKCPLFCHPSSAVTMASLTRARAHSVRLLLRRGCSRPATRPPPVNFSFSAMPPLNFVRSAAAGKEAGASG